jgi:hypothetical protein
MAKKNNRNNKSKGAKQTTQAPMTIQQPKPNYNPSVQDARYITNLNPVGSPEFNRLNEQLGGNYDGGGWVTWNKNMGPGDSGMLASDDFMRAFARANAYREMNNIGLMNRGSVESDAAKFQAQQQLPSAAMQKQPNKTKQNQSGGLRSAIRSAGTNISRQEMKSLLDAAGGDSRKLVSAIATVQANRPKEKAPAVNAGAANLLINNAPMFGTFGDSPLAQQLQSMAGTSAGPTIQGQQTPAMPGTGKLATGMQIGPRGNVRVGRREAAMPSQVQTQAAPVDTGVSAAVDQGYGDMTGFDMYGGISAEDQAYLDLISNLGGMFSSQMNAYQQQMANQMDMFNQFALSQNQEPMRMYGAGQNYNIDAVRAAQRNRPTNASYLRNAMGISSTPNTLSSGMGIGSALGTLGGVVI